MSKRDAVYPHNLDAERAVLGTCILENAVLRELAGLVDDVDFYLERHRKIFGRMVAMHGGGTPIDLVTLSESFRRDGHLDEIGGLTYIASLTDAVPLTSNAAHYAKIVRGKAEQRRAIQIAEDVPAALADAENPSEVMIGAGQKLLALGRGAGLDAGWVWASEIARQAFEAIDGTGKGPRGGRKIDCGIPGLETYTTELRIVAARTSMGKTALTHQLALGAGQKGHRGGIITMETMASQLGIRGLACLARVDIARQLWLLNRRELSDREADEAADGWERLVRAAEAYHALPLAYYDQGRITVEEAGALMVQGVEKHGMEYFMIDYLDIMKASPETRGMRSDEKIGYTANGLKGLAKDLDVAIDLVVQVNRGPEGRPDKRPMMSDLQDSGKIEQAADVIVMLYREGYYALDRLKAQQAAGLAPPSESDLPIEVRRHAEAAILKDRNHGRAGRTVGLSWFREFQRFEALSTREDEP